jgi:hypothetical protein
MRAPPALLVLEFARSRCRMHSRQLLNPLRLNGQGEAGTRPSRPSECRWHAQTVVSMGSTHLALAAEGPRATCRAAAASMAARDSATLCSTRRIHDWLLYICIFDLNSIRVRISDGTTSRTHRCAVFRPCPRPRFLSGGSHEWNASRNGMPVTKTPIKYLVSYGYRDMRADYDLP